MFGIGGFPSSITSRKGGLITYSHVICYGALALSLAAHCFDVALVYRFVSICAIQPWLKKRVVGSTTPMPPACVAVGSGPSPPKVDVFLSEFVHNARVTTRDCDLLGHMNNARYPREADFARHSLFVQCGLFDVCWKGKMPLVTAAQSIRYRRELRFGTRYQIRTRILGWDGGSLYIQQTFLSKDVVHAVLVVKETVAVGAKRKASLPNPLTEAFTRLGWIPYLPTTAAAPDDVVAWADSIAATSSRVSETQR